jgi:flagellar hook-associated protein 1 FlgK
VTSTFGGLSSALTGLNAARLGTQVAGQNVQNANTEGYTRQRVETSAIAPTARTGMFNTGKTAGQGVRVDVIARLGDTFLDARVRGTAGASGYSTARATAMAGIETTLREPGSDGLSAKLNDFWAGWQDVANHPGESAQSGVLLKAAAAVTVSIAGTYQGLESQWNTIRDSTAGLVNEVNASAEGIAVLNGQIREATHAGNSVSELVDRRNLLTEKVASLVGGTVRDSGDGTVEVLVGGNALVTGDSARPLALAGPGRFGQAGTVQVEWAHRPGSPAALDGGKIAGNLSILAPAQADGRGGAIAQAASDLNAVATQIATQVNDIHKQGVTTSGTTGLDFFSLTPGVPAAAGLKVIPVTVDGVAAGAPGGGTLDGSVADRISQLGIGDASPDTAWAKIVTGIGTTSRADQQQAEMNEVAAASAKSVQLSGASVDLDEENISLLSSQHAYQAAARVISAMDEMLDTLINQTGRVGR